MKTPDKPKKPNLSSFAGCDIATSTERGKDGVFGIAYCPICGYRVESHAHGYGEQHAITVSLSKVRTHMKLAHNSKDEAGV